ncbi:hypothetical protein QYM36_019693 [Artemia franciscana]|uniref:Uncharacterized protein n=1 Tax=Artemia franciscana TaxID=6661 RepID=A0AA88H4W4_ARTSF|nr:hypothetical protein QYM36_019693 [Artemia franciscana]
MHAGFCLPFLLDFVGHFFSAFTGLGQEESLLVSFMEVAGSQAIVKFKILASPDVSCCDEERPFDIVNYQQPQFQVWAILLRLVVDVKLEIGLLGIAITGVDRQISGLKK